MKEDKNAVSRLLELKKFEQPDESFTDEVLRDFHRRQRNQLMQMSTRQLVWERLTDLASQWKWAVATVGVAAVVITTSMVVQSDHSEADPMTAAVSKPAAEQPSHPTEAVSQAMAADQIESPLVALGMEFNYVDLSEQQHGEEIEF